MRKKNISKVIENTEKDVSLHTETVQPIVQAIVEPVKSSAIQNVVAQSLPTARLYNESEYINLLDTRTGIVSVVHKKQAKILINTGYYYEKR